jgi:hypothetical protein
MDGVGEGRAISACRESHAALRLARLFRIERSGGFDRRPVMVASRLIERRGVLIAALVAIDCERRRAAQTSPALDQAMAELAREAALSREHVAMRLQQIGKDLRLSRGEGLPSGIRNRIGGRSLGKI